MTQVSSSRRATFDKYAVYTQVVQSPEHDARFLHSLYRRLVGKAPLVLREDFCGTHALSRAWVELRRDTQAVGIDIDREPLRYGTTRDKAELTPEQRTRLVAKHGNVLTSPLSKADIACAFNFSYFCFQTREQLLRYCKRVRASLKKDGIFVLDIFGGPQHGEPSCDSRRSGNVAYQFEQEFFDPISRKTRFHLHFKVGRDRLRKRVFSYDWRMWSIPEVREILRDAGFSETLVYWEGTGRNGRGNGQYSPRDRGESCQVWTAYIVGKKS
jgi:SAM-dependent methyltransferase